MTDLLSNIIEQLLKTYRNISSRVIISFFALLFSTMFYIYLVDFYGQDFSILNSFHFGNRDDTEYNFYSGDKNLIFYQIGEELHKSKPKNIIIKNQQTAGSYDNAEKIVTYYKPSFGLADKAMIDRDETINEQIEFVTPLYLDRLYIVYNPKLLNKWNGNINGESIEISPHTDPKILELFANARINLGPVGSGSKILSSYIINELNKQIDQSKISRKNQHIDTANIEDAINKLADGKVDIGFFLIGCMSDTMNKKLFKLQNLKLVGIESSMVNYLNKEEKLDLKVVKYKDSSLDDAKSNMTLGTKVYLIADKKTPPEDVMEVVKSLNENDMSCGNEKLFSDFRFYEDYKMKSQNRDVNSLRNVLLFITTVFTSFTIAFISLSHFVSFNRQGHYLKQITYVVKSIPNNSEFQNGTHRNEAELIFPLITNNQIPIINKIIIGLQKLIALRKELSDETGLNDEHFDFIQNRIDQIMEKLRKSLFIRLNEMKENGELITLGITKENIRKYFTADWITDDSYRKLIENL